MQRSVFGTKLVRHKREVQHGKHMCDGEQRERERAEGIREPALECGIGSSGTLSLHGGAVLHEMPDAKRRRGPRRRRRAKASELAHTLGVQDPEEVSRGLAEIAALMRFDRVPKFKIQAYENAAEIVKTVGDELGPLVEQDRLRELQGIGAALSRQIQELWNTGSSELLHRLRSEHPEGAADLIQIEGMTPRRILALHEALGIRSVDDLRAACTEQRVRHVPGFGEKTEQRLCAACERWLNRSEGAPPRMLLAHALELATRFERELLPSVEQVHLAGALRRGEETVAEVELLVVGDREPALARLASLRQVLRVDRAQGIGYLSGGMRLQLHAARRDEFGNALLAATGTEKHAAELERRANERGFSLSLSEPHRSFDTEAELYGALGLPWIAPELRTGADELERATRGEFDDLLDVADVKGMVHCHTTYSDGKNSVEEMARAAHALGMQYITITDHSPSAHYAGGVTLDRLKQQWDEIALAQERVPIRILRGTESDILSDGSLDYPDAILEQFDVVIASIHARHRMDSSAMTERIERALSLPLFKIWGHALGRILNHRPPIECDVPRILDALARAGGAIEINADPHRLDLPPQWVPLARERNIPFVISVDAHSTRGLGVLPYGVTMARRGGLGRHAVLNTQSAAEFAERVRPTR
jgi:DNA polymerase (family 10)